MPCVDYDVAYAADDGARYNNILESYMLKTLDVVAGGPGHRYNTFCANDSQKFKRNSSRLSVFRNTTTGLLHFVIQNNVAKAKCLKHLLNVMKDNSHYGSNLTLDDAYDEHEFLFHHPPLYDNPLHHANCGRNRFSNPGFHRVIAYVYLLRHSDCLFLG